MSGQEIIAALATPEGYSEAALLRVSGNGCWQRLRGCLADPPDFHSALPVHVQLRWKAGATTVAVLLIPYRHGLSYTGEESLEIILPGSPPLIRRCLETLRAAGLRPAQPGEFTRRAFVNGRIDLTRAESVAQLIAAENLQATENIRSVLDGNLARRIGEMAAALHRLVAFLEAGLDFVEQEVDAPDGIWLEGEIEAIEAQAATLLAQPGGKTHERPSLRVLIWGRFNAGKSTLFNRLLGEEAAIASPVPGTTRDPNSRNVHWPDTPTFALFDLAGEKEPEDEVELAATRLSAAYRRGPHDLLLYLLDSTASRASLEAEWRALEPEVRRRAWPILNKIDAADVEPRLLAVESMAISAATGVGVAELVRRIRLHLQGQQRFASVGQLLFNERQRGLLEEVSLRPRSIRRGQLHSGSLVAELLVEDLRDTLALLSEVTGETTPEHTLDLIFSSFCLGK